MCIYFAIKIRNGTVFRSLEGENMDNGKKDQILVVDDSRFNLKVMEGILQGEYQVATARSGQECLDYIEQYGADLIFLDIVMKGMDGYEVCQRLKENPQTKDIPIVFVSAHEDVENQTRGLELGAIDYITRPVVPALVKAKAKNYLVLKKHYEMIEETSFYDAMTGIFNRRYLDNYLKNSWEEAYRQQKSLAAIFIDVDYFKKYNDFYGHLAGDVCLQKIAGIIAGSLQQTTDIAARYGGEEFMVVLPETDLDAAIRVASRIARQLCEQKLKHAKSPIGDFVTLSMGVAAVVPTAPQMEKTLVEMTDIALYKAKNAGRNMFKCFEKPNFCRS